MRRNRKDEDVRDTITAALRELWEAGDRACGELIHPQIPEYVATMQRDGQWKHNDELTGKLLAMSEGTTKRRVGVFRKENDARGKGLSGTSPSALKNSLVPQRKMLS